MSEKLPNEVDVEEWTVKEGKAGWCSIWAGNQVIVDLKTKASAKMICSWHNSTCSTLQAEIARLKHDYGTGLFVARELSHTVERLESELAALKQKLGETK